MSRINVALLAKLHRLPFQVLDLAFQVCELGL